MTRHYDLDCTDCTFQESVDGDYGKVFDEIEVHQQENQTDLWTHFVAVQKRAETDPQPATEPRISR